LGEMSMLRPLRISDPQKAALKRISTIHALCRIGRFGEGFLMRVAA
jgi:hypothetical protein